MAKLFGAQKLVLQAIHDLPKDPAGFVTESQVAERTRIALKEVRDWIETLAREDHVEVARTDAGLVASITAQGRLALGLFGPFTAITPPASPASPSILHPAGAESPSLSPQPGVTHISEPALPSPGVVQGTLPVGGPVTHFAARPGGPIRLFYSYTHKDERLREKLQEHLALLQRQGVIEGWHDRKIGAGQEWKGAIDRNLEEAQVILLLVSSSFLASDYCYDIETKRAIERHDRGEARVIPIILRPCDWHGAPFGKLQALPKDSKAVTSWSNKDEAWTDVAKGIRRAVEAMTANPQ